MASFAGPAVARAGFGRLLWLLRADARRPPAGWRARRRAAGKPSSSSRPKRARARSICGRRPGGDFEIMRRVKNAVRSVQLVEPWPTLSPYLNNRARRAAAVRSGPLRPLRPVPERLPHLPRTGPGDGFAARPHLPDGAGGRRRAHHAFLPRAHRPVPGLPRLRIGLPFGRALRPHGGRRARGNRSARAARAAGGRLAAHFVFGHAAAIARAR